MSLDYDGESLFHLAVLLQLIAIVGVFASIIVSPTPNNGVVVIGIAAVTICFAAGHALYTRLTDSPNHRRGR